MPLEAPVITMTCSAIGLSVNSMRTPSSAPVLKNAVSKRAESVSDSGVPRFERGLLQEPEGAALVEHLGGEPPLSSRQNRIVADASARKAARTRRAASLTL
jgi:hypothetical protein